jgi:hypothetical protein
MIPAHGIERDPHNLAHLCGVSVACRGTDPSKRRNNGAISFTMIATSPAPIFSTDSKRSEGSRQGGGFHNRRLWLDPLCQREIHCKRPERLFCFLMRLCRRSEADRAEGGAEIALQRDPCPAGPARRMMRSSGLKNHAPGF